MIEIILISLLTIPILSLLVILIIAAKRHRDRDRFNNKLSEMIKAIGGKQVEDDNYQIGHSIYKISLEPSNTLGSSIDLKISIYSDSIFDYVINEAQTLPEIRTQKIYEDTFYKNFSIEGNTTKELESYLLSGPVKNLVKKIMARWKTIRKNYLELTVSGSKFSYNELNSEKLKTDLKTLEALNLIELNHKPTEGFLTVRTGFEKNPPMWHWKNEEIDALPSDIKRICFSFYDRTPYLNEIILDVLSNLSGDRLGFYLTDYENLNLISYSFGSSFENTNPLFSTQNPQSMISIDNYSDGQFFQGFIAADHKELSRYFLNAKKYQFHDIACKNIDKIYFYARRLLDQEGSWYSGEYEILSLYLTPKDIADVLQATAQKYNAKLLKINTPFSQKIFADERFEFST